MDKFDSPADEVEPDEVIVDEIDDEGHALGLVQVEGGNEEQSEDRGHNEHADFELVLWDWGAEGVDFDYEVGSLEEGEDDGLVGQIVDKQGVDGSEEEGVDRPLEGLEGDCLHGGLLGVLEEVFDQLAVVEGEPEQPPDAEDDEEEEKEDDGHVGQLVAEVEAEEGLALVEEVEGELLDIALVDYEE